MARLQASIKQKLIEEIKRGTSINKVSSYLKLAKSTIYYYYKKIKGKRYQEPKFRAGFTEKDGEIVGIFAGDGSQCLNINYSYATDIHFGSKNIDYAMYVKRLFESFFNKEFSLLKVDETRLKLSMKSKSIFNYFRNFLRYNPHFKHCTVELRNIEVPEVFVRGFLRGLFDTDGSILFKKKENRVRISFCTTSHKLIEQVRSLLEKYNFEYSYYQDARKHKGYKLCHIVQLTSKSIYPFLETIKPFKARGL